MEAFFAAIKQGDRAEVERLLASDPGLASARDADGASAVLTAAYHRQREILAILVATGPELDVFEAATVGDLDRVRALVEADRSLAAAVNTDGFFPLGLAAFFHHPEVVRYLVAAGADPRAAAKNPMNVTALHSAVADGGDRESALALIAAGADVNARQRHGWTALHGAADSGDRAIVEALLAAGADPALANRDGKTAADVARERGHAELVALLESAGSGVRP